MLLHIYCTECGTKHEYTLKCPNFCSSCRNPLTVAAAALKPSDKVHVTPEPQQHQPLTKAPKSARTRLLSKLNEEDDPDDETELDEEDDNEDRVIVPPNPSFSVEMGRVRKERIEDLAQGSGKPQPRQIRAAEGPLAAKSKKAFIKKFQEIAGGKSQGKTI